MTDLAWDLVEDVREIVRLFDPGSISGRPSGVVLYDNDSRLPPTPLLRTHIAQYPVRMRAYVLSHLSLVIHYKKTYINRKIQYSVKFMRYLGRDRTVL